MTKRRKEEVLPVFPQTFGRYRKDERCRICECAKHLQVQENKGQKISDFCGAANMCGSDRKRGSYLGLDRSGAKKDLQVIENKSRHNVRDRGSNSGRTRLSVDFTMDNSTDVGQCESITEQYIDSNERGQRKSQNQHP